MFFTWGRGKFNTKLHWPLTQYSTSQMIYKKM